MAPSPTSTVDRDIAYQLHPFTNLRPHESAGPLVITGGRGIYVLRRFELALEETAAASGR
jgi:hypothetical protein